MSEPSPQEKQTHEPCPFKINVEINGLPYFFEGILPNFPAKFSWYLRIPDWEKQASKIEKDIKAGKVSLALPYKFEEAKRKNGAIAQLMIETKENYGILRHIEVWTWILPQEFGYQGSYGAGSFLMDNLLTFVDAKKLPLFLEPYPDGSSRLSDWGMLAWYRRKRFQDRYELKGLKGFPNPDYGSMVRLPQSPDLTQPIAQLL